MKLFILSIFVCFILFANLILALDKSKDCKCKAISQKRIIGGNIAQKNAYPWQVVIGYNKNHLPDSVRKLIPNKDKINTFSCGGVILNENWILTAGHCLLGIKGINGIDRYEFNNVSIGMGTNDLVKMFDDKKYVEIEETYPHPLYNFVHNSYDIALIKTKTINFVKGSIEPACLNLDDVKKYSEILKISGWGYTTPAVFDKDARYQLSKNSLSRYLKEGEVYDSTDSSATCQGNDKWGSVEHNICVNYQKKKAIACKGDSGGPLHSIDNSGKAKVIGITSFGSSHKNDTNYIVCYDESIYSRISTYKDFIEENIGQNYC